MLASFLFLLQATLAKEKESEKGMGQEVSYYLR